MVDERAEDRRQDHRERLPRKNGSHLANARPMTLSDDRTLFAGSSAETDPK
jgi:hypothetical protein